MMAVFKTHQESSRNWRAYGVHVEWQSALSALPGLVRGGRDELRHRRKGDR
jgi:hypothetical protein